MGWVGPMTHRQYQVWQEWLDEEINHPSRSDYYMMQVAHAAYGGRVDFKKLLLKFQQPKSLTKEEREKHEATKALMSKSAWFAVLGLKGDGTPRENRALNVHRPTSKSAPNTPSPEPVVPTTTPPPNPRANAPKITRRKKR
jgi:hypothetical protein